MSRAWLLVLAPLALSACIVPPQNRNPQPVRPVAPEPKPEPKLPDNQASEFSRNRDYTDVPAQHVKTLSLRCGAGTLKIEGTDDGTMSIQTWIYAWAESAAESERINREIEVNLLSQETENPKVVVSEPQLGHSSRRYEVNMTVRVPRNVSVSVTDGAGSIEVWGLHRGITIQNQAGPVSIHEIRGGIELTNQGGPTQITGASGRISITDSRSDLRISQIDGEIDVRDPGGKLQIHHVSGTVVARGNRDGIELVNVDGEAVLYGIPADRSSLQGVTTLSFKEEE